MVALPTSLSAWSFPLTLACPGQYIRLLWVTANFDTCQSGLSVLLFTFCSKLITHDCNNQQNTCSLHLLIYFSLECRRRRFTPKPSASWETDPSEILNAIFFPKLFQVTPAKLTTIHLTFSWMSSMETRLPLLLCLQM